MDWHKTTKWVRKVVYLVLILILFIVLLNLFILHKEKDSPSDSLLVPDTTCFVPSFERDKRIQFLSDMVLRHQSSSVEASLARGSERMQTRLSFIALIAILIGLFLSLKDYKMQLGVLLAIVFLFLGFYLFDLHSSDFDHRHDYLRQWTDNTVIRLSKVHTSDSIWYNLNYDRIIAWDSTLSAHSFKRKINNFIYPDLSQIAFYFLPFFVFLGLYLFLGKTINDTEEQTPPNLQLKHGLSRRKHHAKRDT
jgi:hypothetical protein